MQLQGRKQTEVDQSLKNEWVKRDQEKGKAENQYELNFPV